MDEDLPDSEGSRSCGHAARELEKLGKDAKAVLKTPTQVYSDTRRGKPTIAGYGDTWLMQADIRATTKESYGCLLRKHIIGGLGNVPVSDLTPAMVREFLATMKKKGVSNATRGSVLKVLRALCRAAVQDELLTRDPTTGMKVAEQQAAERQILSPSEADRLLKAIPGWAKLLVRTALDTGARWGELVAIRPGDIVQGVDGLWMLQIRRTLQRSATSRSNVTAASPARRCATS